MTPLCDIKISKAKWAILWSIKMFNDDKINVIEMPRDLIVAANVDKSEVIHTLAEAFHLF